MFIPKATIVVDLGFGDSGKGTIVDYLARKSVKPTVVRFNGGAQAAHNVHTPDGRHHTFAQFGAGTFVPGVRTHLSRYVLIDPPALIKEAEHLKMLGEVDVFQRLSIDGGALVVTPFHKAANRIREVLRGSSKHGSVGMGIGETVADSIAFPHRAVLALDLRSPETLIEKFRFFQKLKLDEFKPRLAELSKDAALSKEVELLVSSDAAEVCAVDFWRQAMRLRIVDSDYLRKLSLEGDLIFEGAQGVLIDEWHGFHPYTTWSTTTYRNAMTLLGEIAYAGRIEKIGVLRSYFTRHGAGPFPTEDKALSLALPETHNTSGRWQDNFRVGWFDAVLARYAIDACGGVDSIAVTNLDRIAKVRDAKMCIGYWLYEPTRTEMAMAKTEDLWERSSFLYVHALNKKKLLTDLVHQEHLTKIVERVHPWYEDMPRGGEVEMIEKALGVPVSITSHGPTAAHKRVRKLKALAA